MLDLRQYFQLPEKYEVHRTIEKEKYLNSANLTTAERRDVSNYVRNIEILYDILCEDGSEFMIFHIELDHYDNKWTKKTIAKAVASSIPYSSLICVDYNDSIQLCAFWSKYIETNNGARSSIFKMICSDNIYLPAYTPNFFERFRLFLNNDDIYITAATISRMCRFLIERIVIVDTEQYNNACDYELGTLEEENDQIYKDMMDSSWDLYSVEDCVRERGAVNEYYQIYYNNSAFIMFLEQCCEAVYPLYCEYNEKMPINERKWLITYARACEKVANELQYGPLNAGIYRKIKKSFEEENDNEVRDFGEIDALREELDYSFGDRAEEDV